MRFVVSRLAYREIQLSPVSSYTALRGPLREVAKVSVEAADNCAYLSVHVAPEEMQLAASFVL